GPARDRNYEFWGDQTFYGENPPPAAVISWLNKKEVGDVKLKITDAAGREVREISGEVLARRNKPGIQSACWDLRVQPAPPLPPQGRAGRAGEAVRAGEAGRAAQEGTTQSAQQQSPFGAGCAAPGGGGPGAGGGFFGGGAGTAG